MMKTKKGFSFRKRYQRFRRKRKLRAATKIQRAWRKKKSYSTRFKGSSIENCKTYGYWFFGGTNEEITIQKLNKYNVVFPQYGVQGSGIAANGARASENIYVAGIKIDELFVSQLNRPVMLHWAIIQGKRPGLAPNNVYEEFFRDDYNPGEKGRDFVDTLTSWEPYMDFYKINPDTFNIITHQKFYLDPYNTNEQTNVNKTVEIEGTSWRAESSEFYNQNSKTGRWHKRISKYIPIKKRMHFEGGEFVTPTFPIYLVNWMTCFQAEDVDSMSNVGVVHHTLKINVYFKDL